MTISTPRRGGGQRVEIQPTCLFALQGGSAHGNHAGIVRHNAGLFSQARWETITQVTDHTAQCTKSGIYKEGDSGPSQITISFKKGLLHRVTQLQGLRHCESQLRQRYHRVSEENYRWGGLALNYE